MADFTIKSGDQLPILVAKLINPDGTPYIIPAGAVIEFAMRAQNQTSNYLTSSNVIISDASQGLVSYQWGPNDTMQSGLYNIQFAVTLPNGTFITFPNYGFRSLEIVQSI